MFLTVFWLPGSGGLQCVSRAMDDLASPETAGGSIRHGISRLDIAVHRLQMQGR